MISRRIEVSKDEKQKKIEEMQREGLKLTSSRDNMNKTKLNFKEGDRRQLLHD